MKSSPESCSYDLNLPLDAQTKLSFQKEPPCIEHSIIVRNADSTFGPFCSNVEDNGGFGIAPVIANAKRLSTIERILFTGPVEIEIKPTSERRTRLRMLFKWEKVEQCKLSDLADFDESFRKISIADRKPAALSAWRRLTNQLKNFHEDFHLESSRYCAVETLAPPCELVRFSEDATFDKIVEQTKKLLDFLSGLCDSGFSYRWYDSLNQLLFNSGASSRIEAEAIPEEFKIQDKPAEHPVYQQEPVRMVLENEFVVHKRLELETTAGTTVTTPSMLTTQSGRGPPNKLLAEPFFPQFQYPANCGWLQESKTKKSVCSISSLSTCNTALFADVLSLSSSSDSCPVNKSAAVLERIFQYAEKLASNSGFFKGQCATAKKQLPCALMMINFERADQLKPSAFIRKMRMVTRKIVGDCEISHRHELQEMADRIPCELAFIPKNEEGCQLGARLARVAEYLQEKCPALVSQAVSRKLRKLQEAIARETGSCPEIGTKMTREIRLVAINSL
ncbi:unnamed protein product [Oikopleura dioica]|uniref:Uncharacterized protein n=1 Tax=Oikopleura dioica TaxID=34765 RepID=E4XYM5_OIKDI|nr:unnamed protein product [Oikopleura dioica]